MNPTDEWISDHLPSTCPELAIMWIKETGSNLTDSRYQHFKNVINRRMHQGVKYGLYRWTGEVVGSTRAKLWVVI